MNGRDRHGGRRAAMGLAAAVLWLAAGGAAWAQIGGLPGLPGVPSAPGGLPSTDGLAREVRGRLDGALAAPERLNDLIRRSDGALEADPQGWPVVTSEIVAVDLSAEARAWALEAGYTVVREERLEALELTTTVLAPPRRMALRRAVERLRQADPGAEIEYNHVYAPAGGEAVEAGGAAVTQSGAGGARLGLIDTGVAASHPALSGSRVTQRGFAGDARVGAHGTAVASLMVGRAEGFQGADPGADLLVADIYGGQAAGGSSTGLAQALDWMVARGAGVVNISLVGPRNRLVERSVERAQARGLTLVAAVGNDGPSAAALYPASYPGVIGVTAVNGRNRVLPEAGRGPQVDFAGPGADMAAAAVSGGYVSVRGTSFAAPVVAATIARGGGGPTGIAAAVRGATDLGDRGADYVYGAGLVGASVRTAPDSMGARGRLDR